MNFEQTSEFKKELKQLSKKWRTLESDLRVFEAVLPALYYPQDGVPPEMIKKAFFNNKKATILQQISETAEVVKARLDSRALNKDTLRVIYIRHESTIQLIEIYSKTNKSREDQARIKRYI